MRAIPDDSMSLCWLRLSQHHRQKIERQHLIVGFSFECHSCISPSSDKFRFFNNILANKFRFFNNILDKKFRFFRNIRHIFGNVLHAFACKRQCWYNEASTFRPIRAL